MWLRTTILLALIGAGGIVGVASSKGLEHIAPARLARAVLIAAGATMTLRVLAYFAANVLGLTWAKPLSIGPYDLTNFMVGVLYGLGFARGVTELWREDDLRLAVRVATGGAFVLAGLGNAFYLNGPVDYFVAVGYTKSFHYFIMTAEVLGGAALLLPWRWLTLAVLAGLTVDMFGALSTQARVGEPLDAAAFAMLFRLALMAMLWIPTARTARRLATIGMGAAACAIIAIAGSVLLATR
jgi:hypothetical protein